MARRTPEQNARAFALADARAKALGYASYRERRQARAAAKQGDPSRLRPADAPAGIAAPFKKPPRPKPAARKRTPKIVRMPAVPDVVVVTTGSEREIRTQLRQAARRGDNVTLSGTVTTPAGFRHRRVSGHTPAVDVLLYGEAENERMRQVVEDGTGTASLTGKLQLFIGPSHRHSNGGIPAQDLLDYFQDSDEFWQAIADLLDAEY